MEEVELLGGKKSFPDDAVAPSASRLPPGSRDYIAYFTPYRLYQFAFPSYFIHLSLR